MLYMEALMEDKPADYQSLEEILYTYTDGFTKEEGSYPLKDRADRENAYAILKKYYNKVDKDGLDYSRQDDDGTTDYKVSFSDPKYNFEDENTLNETYSFNEDFDIDNLPTFNELSNADKINIMSIRNKDIDNFISTGGHITYANDLDDDPLDDYYIRKYAKEIVKRNLERYGVAWRPY